MEHRVCPWWMGYVLLNPLRYLFQSPERILGPYVKTGMQVMDIGSGMGYFSLPLARLAGKSGKVICVDLQKKMIESLEKRARRAGLSGNIDTRICRKDSLGIDDLRGQIDFALAFAFIHEVPDKERLFSEIYGAMKPDGKLLVAEPKGHVREDEFNKEVALLELHGFELSLSPRVGRSNTGLFTKKTK